jgi:PAP2 superfamily
MLRSFFESHNRELSSREKQLLSLSWVLLIAAVICPTLVRLYAFQTWWVPDFTVFFRVIGMDPMNASGFSSIFVLYLMARPERRTFWGVFSVTVVLELGYLIFFLPSDMAWPMRLISSGGGFAIGGLLGLLLQMLWTSPLPARQRAAYLLRLSIMLAIYPFTSAATLGALSQATPYIYDSYAFLIDGSLGFQPAFEVAKFLAENQTLGLVLSAFYTRLPLWVAVGFFLNLVYADRCYFNLLLAYIVAGIIVMGFYYVLPMVGFDDYLGSKYWPLGPLPENVEAKLIQAPPELPRSCMPSMHVCWILLTFFCVRRISRTYLICGGFLVGVTLVSAMAGGVGHYFIDFFPSVPYALACQALTAYDTSDNKNWRVIGVAYGLGANLLMVSTIRFFGPSLAQSPWLVWPSLCLMVAVALYLESKLASSSLGGTQV